MKTPLPTGISVIMPTYNQAGFIRFALQSLFVQTYTQWELIIVNDGSTDQTELFIEEYLKDERITYLTNERNRGLGYSINRALDMARYDLIAYLPSDDFYYETHLENMVATFNLSDEIVLVYSGAESKTVDSFIKMKRELTMGLFRDCGLQLVQTSHRKTTDRWVTREEWVCGDLFDLFWNKLTDKGEFRYLNKTTCQWSHHPHQHHKLVSEKEGGGINIFRHFYNVKDPLKIKVSKNKFVDEEELYKAYHKPFKPAEKPLKILLVGELAYHPERIYALEEAGHTLYGLWMSRPTYSFSTVGPLPFGHVEDIDYNNWQEEVLRINPDIIYASLNYGAIPLAWEVMTKVSHIPFVWHFKEGPLIARREGTWEKLMQLYYYSDGKIYLNPEIKEWFEQYIPASGLSFILDGDLPKKDYFTDDFSEKLSMTDGDIHTVVPGRPIGLEADDFKVLAANRIHTHMYIENYFEGKIGEILAFQRATPHHIHIHSHCSASDWVKEFSQYDAGWLHCFDSSNNGNLALAGWDDLNMPARMSTLAAAGLPIIQKDNTGHVVAMQNHIRKKNMGIFYKDIHHLATQLHSKGFIQSLQENALKERKTFTFDYYVDELVLFFREVIESKKKRDEKSFNS